MPFLFQLPEAMVHQKFNRVIQTKIKIAMIPNLLREYAPKEEELN